MADKVMGRSTTSAAAGFSNLEDFVNGMRESAGASSRAIVNSLLAASAVGVYMKSRR